MSEQLDIFGSSNCEYLIIIEPDPKIIEKVIGFKKLLISTYHLSTDSLHSKPHISLCYFESNDFSDDLIIEKSKLIASNIKSFKISIIGPEKWRNGTLILKIDQDKFIRNLQYALSKNFKGVLKTIHLTISRNIPSRILDNLSLEDFKYAENFMCKSILILKKTKNAAY
jgi:hypothetical protein